MHCWKNIVPGIDNSSQTSWVLLLHISLGYPKSFLSKRVCKSNQTCPSKYFSRYALDDMECCGSNT